MRIKSTVVLIERLPGQPKAQLVVPRCWVVPPQEEKSLEAPSWLWNSVVDLVAAHEAAYLQHCRRYALDAV